MPDSDSISPTHQLLRAPVPNEWALEVFIDQGMVINSPDIIPAAGTAYKSFPRGVLPLDLMPKFQDYILVTSGDGPPGKLSLIFGKNKTPQQAQTPFRSQPKFGNHYWPPVLKALEIIPDPGTPRSYRSADSLESKIFSGPSFYVRVDFIPEVNEGTLFLVEEFFGPTPFQVGQHPTPQPGSVSWDLPGVSGGFPSCLHRGITIEDHLTATSVQTQGVEGGSSASIGSGIRGQFFPATNFTDWSPYILSEEQSFQNGYHLVRTTVFPPPRPKLTIK
jgi:hypothetical protein